LFASAGVDIQARPKLVWQPSCCPFGDWQYTSEPLWNETLLKRTGRGISRFITHRIFHCDASLVLRSPSPTSPSPSPPSPSPPHSRFPSSKAEGAARMKFHPPRNIWFWLRLRNRILFMQPGLGRSFLFAPFVWPRGIPFGVRGGGMPPSLLFQSDRPAVKSKTPQRGRGRRAQSRRRRSHPQDRCLRRTTSYPSLAYPFTSFFRRRRLGWYNQRGGWQAGCERREGDVGEGTEGCPPPPSSRKRERHPRKKCPFPSSPRPPSWPRHPPSIARSSSLLSVLLRR